MVAPFEDWLVIDCGGAGLVPSRKPKRWRPLM